ncbi:hypothetical protein KC357_g8 [Hortaea werneckii]|nr:hypothetical protein KC357_g8 [Hortaea werneckii]
MAPSRTKNSVSLFQISPLNPSHSSATRYADRMRIKTVARTIETRKTLKTGLLRTRCLSWSMFNTPLLQRRAKSPTTSKKTAKLIAWRKSPAIIMSMPDWLSESVSAVSAIAPPAACKTREQKSDVIKSMMMRPMVILQLCNIAQDFQDEPDYHCNHQAPCLVEYAESDLWNDEDAEKDGVEEVTTPRWDECEDTLCPTTNRCQCVLVSRPARLKLTMSLRYIRCWECEWEQ